MQTCQGRKVKSLQSLLNSCASVWLQREPCTVAHGKNEGEASCRDTKEIKVRKNFSTVSVMLGCRKLRRLHPLKFLLMSFFHFQTVLGAKRCSYSKNSQKMR